MTRDLRDPQKLGEYLLWCRNTPSFNAQTLSVAYDAHLPEFWDAGGLCQSPDGRVHRLVPDYVGDGFMSNDPSEHHSGTKQAQPIESDGGE